MRQTVVRVFLVAGVLAVVGAGARGDDAPRPPAAPAAPSVPANPAAPASAGAAASFDGSRAALAIPDAVWARSLEGLGLAKGATLGFTAEQMANYGRDVCVTRPIATLFRDVRAIPRVQRQARRHDPRGGEGPFRTRPHRRSGCRTPSRAGCSSARRAAAWGVDWLPATASPADALPKVLERLASATGRGAPAPCSRATTRARGGRSPRRLQRFVVRMLVGCVEGAPWLRAAFDARFLCRRDGQPRAAGRLARTAPRARLAALVDGDETRRAGSRVARASFEALEPRRPGLRSRSAPSSRCCTSRWRSRSGGRRARDVDPRASSFAGLELPTRRSAPVRILGPGDDVDAGAGGPALLEFDLGGNDIRRGRHGVPAYARARRSRSSSTSAANDRVRGGAVDGTLGCGLFGLGGRARPRRATTSTP